jgi:hypothetical protein
MPFRRVLPTRSTPLLSKLLPLDCLLTVPSVAQGGRRRNKRMDGPRLRCNFTRLRYKRTRRIFWLGRTWCSRTANRCPLEAETLVNELVSDCSPGMRNDCLLLLEIGPEGCVPQMPRLTGRRKAHRRHTFTIRLPPNERKRLHRASCPSKRCAYACG